MKMNNYRLEVRENILFAKKHGLQKGTPSQKKQQAEYYLEASADPRQIICDVMLTENNYERWETLMRNALKAKSKVGFIHGVVKKPQIGANKLKMWFMVNEMLVSWILNSIHPELRSSIPCPKTAFELWQSIREKFSVVQPSSSVRPLGIDHNVEKDISLQASKTKAPKEPYFFVKDETKPKCQPPLRKPVKQQSSTSENDKSRGNNAECATRSSTETIYQIKTANRFDALDFDD